MKYLIIWNNLSYSFIENNLRSNPSISSQKAIKIIRSNNEWQKFDINKDAPDQIIILVELNWTEHDCLGYSIALEIIKDWKDEDKAPNIQFISFMDQDQLYDFNKGIDKFIAKTFRHYRLPLIDNFQTDRFIIEKWNYLKKYALTKAGILDKIKHDLDRVFNKEREEITLKVAKEFVERMTEIKDIIGDKLLKQLNDFSQIKDDYNSQQFLDILYSEVVTRIRDLSIETNGPSNTDSGSKVLILEDNISTLNKLKDLFSPHFKIVTFTNGAEALEELKINGRFYHAVIVDLELLEPNQKVDQVVQGIEVIVYARDNYPHLARRVITSLGTIGILELLPEVSYHHILSKSDIDRFGDIFMKTELFISFIQKLQVDIKNRLPLNRMVGPDNVFWGVYSRQGTKGRAFKRFYYNLQVEQPKKFQETWAEVITIVESLESNKSVQISFQFGKTSNTEKWDLNTDSEKTISFLQLLLIHRLYWIRNYKNGEFIVYKNMLNKGHDFYNKTYWRNKPPASPKQYFYYLGFGCKKLEPKTPKEKDQKITFYFKYNQLLPEELKYIKSKSNLVVDRLSSFYQQHESLCICINQILEIILSDQEKRGLNSQFTQKYPQQLDNEFELDQKEAVKILNILQQESVVRSRHKPREMIMELIEDFKYKEDGSLTFEYQKTPTVLSESMDRILETL
ncbi:MAG: response regulator [Bacteroidota bacterium]